MVQIITITKLLNDNFHNKINQMFFFFAIFCQFHKFIRQIAFASYNPASDYLVWNL